MVDVLVILDGASAGSLHQARTPTLDRLAAEGTTAVLRTTPPGLAPGSETCIPALLGCQPREQPGRGRVDAAAYSIEVPAGLIPWRADVLDDEGSRVSEAQAAAVAAGIGAIHTRGHRLLVLDADRPPGTDAVHVWDDGPAPAGPLPTPTAIVCATGAAAGVGRLLGAQVTVPAGATGDVDTDLGAKRGAASAAIAEGWPRVVVHMGAPDEAAHRLDPQAVVDALERIDEQLLAPFADDVHAVGGRLTVCPDHETDPTTGRHTAAPVRAVSYDAQAVRA